MFFLLFITAACGRENPIAGADGATTTVETVIYGAGFYPPEQDATHTWRWMGPEGNIRLRNPAGNAVLTMRAHAPVDRFPQPPVITISLNGQPLDRFTATANPLRKTYKIPAPQSRAATYSDLKITCDQSFTPRQTDPASADTRALCLSLEQLAWEPAQ
ncbi:MAG: hypothetical protein ACKV2V_10725 [Blastocatellia bacterium]